MRVGIPRAFYFYAYPGLWEAFIHALGHEPVLSAPSGRGTLERAAPWTESEHCLPHKIFDGHVAELRDRVDAILVPRVLSMTAGFVCCAKFGAMPDACAVGSAGGVRLLVPTVDANNGGLPHALRELGRELGASKETIHEAIPAALAVLEVQRKRLTNANAQLPAKRILLLGHPYTLHDPLVSDVVQRKLARMGHAVEIMDFARDAGVPDGLRWCTFHKMERTLRELSVGDYLGVVQIVTFNCGADSVLADSLRRTCAQRDLPYMSLMVDEHSGRAGVETRLEAFVDSLAWRTHG